MMKRSAVIASLMALVSAENDKLSAAMLKVAEECAEQFAACEGDKTCSEIFLEGGDLDADACAQDEVCEDALDCIIDNAVLTPEDMPEGLPEQCNDEFTACQEDENCRPGLNAGLFFEEVPVCMDDLCEALVECFEKHQGGEGPDSDEPAPYEEEEGEGEEGEEEDFEDMTEDMLEDDMFEDEGFEDEGYEAEEAAMAPEVESMESSMEAPLR